MATGTCTCQYLIHCMFVPLDVDGGVVLSELLQVAPPQHMFLKLVVLKISAKWRTFGSFLNIPSNDLDGMQLQSPLNDPVECFTRVYDHWKRSFECPFTWETAVNVLNTMGEKSISQQLKLELLKDK